MELMKTLINGCAEYEKMKGHKPEAIYLSPKQFDELTAVLYRYIKPPADGKHMFNGVQLVRVEAH